MKKAGKDLKTEMYRRILHKRYKGRRFLALLALLSILIAMTAFLTKFDYSYFICSKNFDGAINEICRRHEVDPSLIKAVIWRESRFNPNARGSKGEIGLMQIRKNYSAADWSKESGIAVSCEGILFHPELNIEIGAWYLARAVKRWSSYEHSFEMALAEYNAGYTGMKKWLPPEKGENIVDRITFEPTKDYVNAIMEKYEQYSNERK